MLFFKVLVSVINFEITIFKRKREIISARLTSAKTCGQTMAEGTNFDRVHRFGFGPTEPVVRVIDRHGPCYPLTFIET